LRLKKTSSVLLTKGYSDVATSASLAESKRTDDRIAWREHGGILVPILIMYFALALYRIDHQSFWVDEILSLETATAGGSFFSPSIWERGQGPLYFAILHLWSTLSEAEGILRSLSALFGGTAVCLIYWLAVRLFDHRVAQFGAIIFATSPFVIWYSQELRYITLAITTALLATYALRRALGCDRRSWWLAYSCTVIVAISALVTNVFVIVFHGLYMLAANSRRLLVPWLCSQLLVLLVLVWWANGGQLWQLGGWCKKVYLELTVEDKGNLDRATERLWSGGRREFTTAALPYTFFSFSTGFSLGPSLLELHQSQSLRTLSPYVPIITASAVLFMGLSMLGIVRLWRHPDARLFFNLWLTVPVIGTLVISALTEMTFNVRYVSASLPAYVLLLAVGIAGCRRITQIVLIVAVLVVNGYALSNYYFDSHYSREDARGAARFLEGAKSGDIVLVVGNSTGLRYYYKGELKVETIDARSRSVDMVAEELQKFINRSSQLWLVESRWWQTDPNRIVKATLDSLSGPNDQKRFSGINVYRYDLQGR
jgi:4-amino-4-deoxy-L-arabinose transferase-like glycosyltransferase